MPPAKPGRGSAKRKIKGAEKRPPPGDMYTRGPELPKHIEFSTAERRLFHEIGKRLTWRGTLARTDKDILVKFVRLSILYDTMLDSIIEQGNGSMYSDVFPKIATQYQAFAKVLGIGTLNRSDPKIIVSDSRARKEEAGKKEDDLEPIDHLVE